MHVPNFAIIAYLSMCKRGLSPIVLFLFYFPDIQCDTAAGTAKTGLAQEQTVIQPGILAVLGSLELGSATEIHAALATHLDDTVVAYVDGNAVIGTDAVDCLNLIAAVNCKLIIGTAGKDLTLDVGTLECSAGDRYDGACTLTVVT